MADIPVPVMKERIKESVIRWADKAEAAAKRAEDREKEADSDLLEHVLTSPGIDAAVVVKGATAQGVFRLHATEARTQANHAKQAARDAKTDLGAVFPGRLLGHAIRCARACEEAQQHAAAAEEHPLPSEIIVQG